MRTKDHSECTITIGANVLNYILSGSTAPGKICFLPGILFRGRGAKSIVMLIFILLLDKIFGGREGVKVFEGVPSPVEGSQQEDPVQGSVNVVSFIESLAYNNTNLNVVDTL